MGHERRYLASAASRSSGSAALRDSETCERGVQVGEFVGEGEAQRGVHGACECFRVHGACECCGCLPPPPSPLGVFWGPAVQNAPEGRRDAVERADPRWLSESDGRRSVSLARARSLPAPTALAARVSDEATCVCVCG